MKLSYFFNCILLCFGCLVILVEVGCKQKKVANQNDKDISYIDSSIQKMDIDIASVNIILENSASMAGYFRERTDFSDHIDDIITKLNATNNFKGKVTAFTLCEELIKYDDIDKFQSDLRLEEGASISIGLSSKLDELISKVFQNTDKNEVSLLITDGIMSGTDDQIKEYYKKYKKHYNQEQKNALKNEVFKVVDQNKADFFIKIFGMKSSFNGNYYKLDNSKLSGKFTTRPYYIIAIGDTNVYEIFDFKTRHIFKYDESLTLGSSFSSLKFKPFPFVIGSLNVETDLLKGEIKVKNKRKEYSFGVLANLDKLPDEYRKKEQLNKNIRLEVNGKKEFFSTTSYLIDDIDVPLQEIHDPKVKVTLNEFTHLIIFKTEDYIYSEGDRWKIIVSKKSNFWPLAWSSDEDFNIDFKYNKTFNFKYMIEGMENAYPNKHIYEQDLILK